MLSWIPSWTPVSTMFTTITYSLAFLTPSHVSLLFALTCFISLSQPVWYSFLFSDISQRANLHLSTFLSLVFQFYCFSEISSLLVWHLKSPPISNHFCHVLFCLHFKNSHLSLIWKSPISKIGFRGEIPLVKWKEYKSLCLLLVKFYKSRNNYYL